MLFFFFFNDTATTEIYTLSLHDALPISRRRPDAGPRSRSGRTAGARPACGGEWGSRRDRKSTRLNSSHLVISYAVFCLKKKKKSTDRASCLLDWSRRPVHGAVTSEPKRH